MGKKIPPADVALARETAEMLKVVRKTNLFRNKKRLIFYKGNDERELVGEHTDQLVMLAWFVQQRYLPHLDLLKVILYALVHDWPEIYAEDTPAFPDKSGRFDAQVNPATKEERERLATQRLEEELGGIFWPMFIYLEAYERKEDEESRFVYALDKFLSDLNIYEDDGRTNILLQVTHDEQIAYKRPRIAQHEFLLGLYDDFCRYCRDHRPDVHFQPSETAGVT